MKREINSIIGKGKDLEPPFAVRQGDRQSEAYIEDASGAVLLAVSDICMMDDDKCLAMAVHIADLLNREHSTTNKNDTNLKTNTLQLWQTTASK